MRESARSGPSPSGSRAFLGLDGLPNVTHVDIKSSGILPLWTEESDASLARLKTFHDTIRVPTADPPNAPSVDVLVEWNHDHFKRMLNLENVLLRFIPDEILVINLSSFLSCLPRLRVFDVHFTIRGPGSFWSVQNCIEQLNGMSFTCVEELRLSVSCDTGTHRFNQPYVHSLYNRKKALVPLFFSAFPNVRYLTLCLETARDVNAEPSILAPAVGVGCVVTPDWLVGNVRKYFPAVVKILVEYPTFGAGVRDTEVVWRLAELLGQCWSVYFDGSGVLGKLNCQCP